MPADIHLLSVLLSIMLPIALGYGLKQLRVFREEEVAALRKFVMKVCIPFLIFANLYHADMASLLQALPIVCAFVLLTALYTLVAAAAAPRLAPDASRRLTFAFSVFAGNYAFLGWGIISSFFGDQALIRAVFFSMFFWPVFLVSGFFLRRRLGSGLDQAGHVSFGIILLRNAGVPIGAALTALLSNIAQVRLPVVVDDFVNRFAAIAIPLILFAIGQNVRLLMPRSMLKLVAAASALRLVFGFVLGLAVWAVLRLVFSVDNLSSRVILLQSVMPTATMSTFFAEYAPLDEELLAGIIAVSTLLSFVTLPLWVTAIEALVPR